MHRAHPASKAVFRPPSAPPSNTSLKRKERDFEQSSGDDTNINVVVRCRGRNDREVRENSGVVLSTTGVSGKNVELSMGPNAISNKTYQFDRVFSPAADQAIIFDDVVAPILSEMLAGYNCTIFAYGQTGTGKTYTMSGDMTESCGLLTDGAGIIPRVLQSLFQKLEADEADCTVKCSFIELYNEDLRDLLSTDDSVKLKIYDDANKKGHGGTLVQGMEESHITSAAEGIAQLQRGSLRRQVAATKCNDLSSRSHTVFTITAYIKKTRDANDEYVCAGKLNLVDLAGSENIQRSGAENKRATEAGLINKSLLTLGRVINALVDKGSHIPYRESKLTRLLQDSLGGRTKTCIIATVSPARSNLEETISTLDYAFRAKNIRNKPQVNSMLSKKTLLKEFTVEIEKLKSELIATRQRNGVYLSNERYEEMTIESESRRILSEEQKARIETMEVSLRNKVHELFSLTNTFTSMKKDTESLRLALESTSDILEKTEMILAHTKDDLQAESDLRQRYAVNEEKLHGVGKVLLSTIDTSLQDVEALHAKLRRRSNLHHDNQKRWQEIRDRGNGVLHNIGASLEELEEDHSSALEAASDRIQNFISAELVRDQSAQTLVIETGQLLSAKTEQSRFASTESCNNINQVVEGIKVLREDVKTKVGDGLNGLSEAAARISGEVISELDQFHTQLHSSYSSLGKEIKAAFDDLSRQLSSQREESDHLRIALQNANQRNLQLTIDAASNLQSAVETEQQIAVKDREALMRSIGDLISKSDHDREARINTLLTKTHSGLIEATQDFEQADRAYGQGMDQWNVQDGVVREKIAQSKEDIKNKFKKDWISVSERNSKIQDSTKAVHQETVKIVAAQVKDIAGQMAALDDFVTRAREQNTNHHEQHLNVLQSLSDEVGVKLEEMQKRLSSSTIDTFAIGIKAHMDEIASTFADVQDRAREPLQQLQQDLGESVMLNYSATGSTPQRREWYYPSNLPRTIPQLPSTTPAGKPPTALTRSRTPGRSPRKHVSPRKSPKKQIVRADTPPQDIELPQLAKTTSVLPDKSSQLKELNVNIPFSDPGSQRDLFDDSKVSITSSNTQIPTKAPTVLMRSDSVTSAAEQMEKENMSFLNHLTVTKPVVSIIPIPKVLATHDTVVAHHDKFSKSLHVPRLTRSSTAALKRGTLGALGRSESH